MPESGQARKKAGDQALVDWSCGELAGEVLQRVGQMQVRAYPALVDAEDHAELRLLDSLEAAQRAHRAGVRRLLLLREAKTARNLKKNIRGLQEMRLQYAKAAQNPDPEAAPAADLLDELLALAFDRAFLRDPWLVRDRAAFEACREQGRPGLGSALTEISGLAGEILAAGHRVRTSLAATTQPNWTASVKDMQAQLDRLIYRGFLVQTTQAQLPQFPRYLKALGVRLEKLKTAAARDQQLMQEMNALQSEWLAREQQLRGQGGIDPRLDEIRWMLEELRVSLFAQGLKTAYPVSIKRIRKRWEALGL